MSGNVGAFFDGWKRDVSRLKKEAPDVLAGFGALFSATMKEGALGVREKELIAMALGLAERCEPCIYLHIDKCLKAGATRAQVLEAAGVAVMMRGGPAYTYLPRVLEALDHLQPTGAAP